ncbi:hypothetical protein [Burkholderia cepacia]|uniref:hypothetical protein n=1 Tax=Burkholderia cepacia TaxID=292 RepID=UPI00075CD20B|nr:hypothetical protein [Burkholderia cepacia]KVW77464.1 hypothetical protein WL00_35945 [Burkholderia cepacia]KVX72119.1 hypothetical protein WL07_15035 [Burkholderia cepacia]
MEVLFDGLGFVRSLARMAFDATGRNVLLIGAGGAASALATALAERRAARIGLFDPDTSTAVQLAETVVHAFPECQGRQRFVERSSQLRSRR